MVGLRRLPVDSRADRGSGMESNAFALFADYRLRARIKDQRHEIRRLCVDAYLRFISNTRRYLSTSYSRMRFVREVTQRPQQSLTHEPVLKYELVQSLVTDPSGVYVDTTFGRGGHAKALLDRLDEHARLIGIDRDADAMAAAVELTRNDDRLLFRQARFSQLQSLLRELRIETVNGICFDVGMSTPQVKDAERGFAFDLDGPLDMRMDMNSGEPACAWLNRTTVNELARVLRTYGDVKPYRKIARAIVARRPMARTTDLVSAVRAVNPPNQRSVKLLAQVFQAIRIHVNDELNELEQGLIQAFDALAIGGRLAVITFHSLEHRLLRHCIRHWIQSSAPRRLPLRDELPRVRYILKNVRPSYVERQRNPHSRSAMMQLVERLG